MTLTLEELLTLPAGFGLTTASPVQRAWCRMIEGRPLGELATDPGVIASVGGVDAVAALPVGEAPDQVDCLAAIRTGKTLIGACAAVHATQTIDVSALRPGEIPRVVFLSLTIDHARVALSHLTGSIQARPALRKLLIGKPTADGVMLRHPSGRPVEIAVLPIDKAGGSVVSRWIGRLLIDEYPRSPWEGAHRVQDVITAARGRMLPGAQILAIGSPWAPAGPAYNDFATAFSRPSPRLVVLRGTGPMLNPSWWTPERCERLRRTDPVAYRTDVEGEFVDGEAGFLDPEMLRFATRSLENVPPPPPEVTCYAGADLATRRNATTLVVAWQDARGFDGRPRLVVGYARQWQGRPGAPLVMSQVFREMARDLRPYRVRRVTCDRWSFDTARELASQAGLLLKEQTSEQAGDMYQAIEKWSNERALSLPASVANDLRPARKVALTGGGFRIELPITPDGRHCDFAPAAALAALQAGERRPGRILSEIERHVQALENARGGYFEGGVFDPGIAAMIRDSGPRDWSYSDGDRRAYEAAIARDEAIARIELHRSAA